MPRFAANLTLLFTEYPVLQRFERARAAGFEAVEMLFPYTFPAADIGAALRANDLKMALINTPTPDWDAGGRGCAAVPGQVAQFRREFQQAVGYANAVQAQHIHIMAGLASGAAARQTFAENLAWAAQYAPQHSLTIEPINPGDMPGYFLNDFDQAIAILDILRAPNLHLQFDAYHAHKITGDALGAWATYGHRAAHIQIAGAEGRHEPVAGAIDYPAFFEQPDALAYPGFVSAEYFPATRTQDGLDWLPPKKYHAGRRCTNRCDAGTFQS